MKNWEYLAAVAALAAAVWSRARAVAVWLRGLVVVVARLDNPAAFMLISYLDTISKSRASSRERNYVVTQAWVRPLGRVREIIAENPIETVRWYWIGQVPLRIGWHYNDHSSFRTTVEFPRGLLDVEKLLIAAEGAQGKQRDRFMVRYHHGIDAKAAHTNMGGAEPPSAVLSSDVGARPLGWRPDQLGRAAADVLGALALSPIHQAMLDEARNWRDSADWYGARGLAWRRGFLLTGAPGTGKTSFARGLAADLNLPAHVMDLSTMSNGELQRAWRSAVADAPSMILVEDVDGVFRGRERVSEDGPTFDALLNAIDGIERADGVLLVITTNHPEHIDPALRRPGRIDREIEFQPLGQEARSVIARRILGDTPESRELASEHCGSAAEFTETCCRLALEARFAKLPQMKVVP